MRKRRSHWSADVFRDISVHFFYDVLKCIFPGVAALVMAVLYAFLQCFQRQPMKLWALLAMFIGSLVLFIWVGRKFTEAAALLSRRSRRR